MTYLIGFLTLVVIYSIVAISLNVLLGYTGIFSMSQAALFGIGAYTSAILTMKYEMNFFLAIIIAIIVTMIASAIISIPAIRISGDYFVVASMALSFIAYDIFVNWTSVTNGPSGLAGVPKPNLFGFYFYSPLSYFLLTIFFLVLVLFVTHRLTSSPIGRILRAIGEDELAVMSIGKNVNFYKILVAIVSSAFAGLAGSLYAHYISFINPSTFTLHESIVIAVMVILAGSGKIWGSIVGTLILLGFPELLKFANLNGAYVGALQQLLYGVLLVVFMMFRPQGLFGKVKPSKVEDFQKISKE